MTTRGTGREPAGTTTQPPGHVAVVAEQLRRRVPGGIGRYATGLLTGLSQLSPLPSVTVVASAFAGSRPDPLAAFPFPLRIVGGPLLAAAARLRPQARVADRMVTRLWDHDRLRLGGYDLVHADSLSAPPCRAPLTVMVHDVAWRTAPEAYPARGRAWHEAALQRVLRDSAGLVVPSQAVAHMLEEVMGRAGRHHRLEVIPEGCDHLAPADVAGAEGLLRRLGLAGPFLLSVSTLEPRKNLRRLLAAYELARPELPEPWPLLVVGPAGWGDGPAPVEGVHWAGEVSENVLTALYEAARLVAYVPLAEGYGLPAVEALACGAPLLVSSAVPSVVEHDAPAVVVEPRSVEEMAAAIGELATDEPRRQELARLGPESVRSRTWRSAAEAHVRFWAEVAG